jgi:hypothetical protein
MRTTSKTLLMQRVLDAARFEYWFYTTGALDDADKLAKLTRKFALVYDTDVSRGIRYRRRKAGEAVTWFHVLERSGRPRYWFILLATEGVGRIHQYEELKDLHHDRLQLDGYALVHDGQSWSWHMTQETYQAWRTRMHMVAALPPARRRQETDHHGAFDIDAEKLLASLYRVPGFRLIRRQVGQLVTYFKTEWQRLRPNDGVQPRWRSFLGYVRRLPNAPAHPKKASRVAPVASAPLVSQEEAYSSSTATGDSYS